MPDVGDVHHVPDAVAVPLEHALQHVLEQEGAEVADVLIVVDRRPAGVKPGRTGLQRLERPQLACVVVVQPKRCRHLLFRNKKAASGFLAARRALSVRPG